MESQDEGITLIKTYSDNDNFDSKCSQKHEYAQLQAAAFNESPSPRKHVSLVLWPVSQEEKNIIESVCSAQHRELNRLEQEIVEHEKQSHQLHAECRKLWLWVQELASALQENKIKVPILASCTS